jgi:ribonuclease T1
MLLVGVLAVTLLGVVGIGLLGAGASSTAPSASPSPSPSPSAGSQTPRSGLPSIAVADLPKQARDTLALIDRGGPYPYSQDNTVFSNLERVLPERPKGYYREYTVVSPGSSSRGTRRLVVGAQGDIYFTADHYQTFRQVLR